MSRFLVLGRPIVVREVGVNWAVGGSGFASPVNFGSGERGCLVFGVRKNVHVDVGHSGRCDGDGVGCEEGMG